MSQLKVAMSSVLSAGTPRLMDTSSTVSGALLNKILHKDTIDQKFGNFLTKNVEGYFFKK
jgi:hypothetical protein